MRSRRNGFARRSTRASARRRQSDSRPRAPLSPEQVVARQPWNDLLPYLERAGVDAPSALDRLRRFATLVIEWNRSVSNIISRNDEARIVTRHVRESIEPVPWLKEAGASTWLDFGSGAGFPGIPLALLGVGERWTLVESRRPKTLFLRKAIQDLGMNGIEIYHGRLESMVRDGVGARPFDVFSSRATLRLAPTLKLAESFVAGGGRAFLWKGSRREDELRDSATWGHAWKLDQVATVGLAQAAVVIFSRIK